LEKAEQAAIFGLWSGPARRAEFKGVGLAVDGRAYYVPLGEQDGEASPQSFAEALGSALSRAHLVTHDAKEMELALRSLGLQVRAAFGTHLAAYLLGQGARDPRLEDLAREFLNRDLASIEQLLGTGRSARPLGETTLGEAADFAAPRAQAILQLEPRLAAELINIGVDYLFREVEMPLAAVLAEMEWEGVAVDVPYLREMQVELSQQLAAIENQITEVAGHPINVGAPQQLAKLLFEDLSLPTGKRIKTGYSTDADTLEALRDRHPVVALILEHRQLSKMKSTYVDALPGLVDPLTGRVHTSLNQAATATGRLSSSNPNLMNIPIRTELGQRIRRAFKADRPAHVLFGADYSQIELRIAAHLSQDPQLLSAFEAGHDIHASTASRVFKVPLEEVDPNQRRLAKVANFGSIYGQGEYGLSTQMGIPGDEARDFLAQYWQTYAKLREYLEGVRNRAREDGFVASETGRRRAIPDLRSPNYQLRQAAERMAINFPMQSLAADIIKIAMVRLQRQIEDSGLRGRMILQVHDELLFEVPETEVDAFEEMVPAVMVGAYHLTCGLEVETKVGPNWADMRRLVTVQA
jgi:DNA polymerase-1